MNKSIATIRNPEFINLTPLEISPLMSKCEIKVLYVGENRNRSYISKEVATEMAKTLRGAPIVGYYKQAKEDFRDHGEEIVFNDEGMTFNCLTTPYGFVSPDAKVWFQEFEEENKFGEKITREYLMTTGYLWTGQFEECRIAVEGEGKPHSMELDEESLDGSWETNAKGMEFFIINDATFSKLCILGDDIEPCFEGSKISAPEVSASFTKEEAEASFKTTLFNMMQALKKVFALEGGQQMDNENTVINTEFVEEPTAVSEEPVVEEPVVEAEPAAAINEPVAEEFKCEDDDEKKSKHEKEEDEEEEEKPAEDEEKPAEEEEDEDEKKYSLLEADFTQTKAAYNALIATHDALTKEFEALKVSYDELVEFKRQADNAKKMQLVDSFTMLADEDKKEVIDNISKFSLEEIEEKLSVICFRKGEFNKTDSSNFDNNVGAPISFKLGGGTAVNSSKPAWLTRVDEVARH